MGSRTNPYMVLSRFGNATHRAWPEGVIVIERVIREEASHLVSGAFVSSMIMNVYEGVQ
jgi:hypothetical protein